MPITSPLNNSVKFFMLLCISLIAFGCESNDDDAQPQNLPENYISYDGNTYEISAGFFEHSGSENEFSMALFPAGIEFNPNDNSINGGSWYLEIEPLLTLNNTIEGSYTCGVDVFSYFINNAQFVNDVLQEGYEVSELNAGGTLTINKTTEGYELSYNATDSDGKTFSAYYHGVLINND